MSGPFTEDPRIPAALPTTPAAAVRVVAPPLRAYPLDNDDALAATHHHCLSVLLDPFSRMRTCELFEPGGGLHGRRCLDVGAGIGARYALWLAHQVGQAGHVIALDVKPRDVPAHPRLDVVEGDVTSKDALPGVDFDFIHARLTLAHLPQRRDILGQLVAALKPGGQILIEDWDASRTELVLAAPSLEAAEQFTIVRETVGRLFATAGTDRAWARRIHAALLADGLAGVHTVIHAESWAGGGVGARLVATTIDELRPALLAAGRTQAELDRAKSLLADPRLALAGHALYSTSGRKPGDR